MPNDIAQRGWIRQVLQKTVKEFAGPADRPLIVTRYMTWGLGLSLLLWVGCAEQTQMRRSLAQPYHPANLHQGAERLPAHLRRVAVLPLTAGEKDLLSETDVATLEAILLAELRKRAAFEVVSVSPERLREWSGQANWRQEDLLPAGLLAKLREHTGSDGVLFAHLSVYRPYPPLAVGWRLSLIDCAERVTHWAVDEVFDAGSLQVIKAAQIYFRSQMNQPSVELDSTAVLTSPRRFGQYSAAAILATLPKR